MSSSHSSLGGARGILLASLLVLAASGLAWGGAWVQVNLDGFDSTNGPTADGTELLVFDNALYAFNEDGLFRMSTTSCISWTQLNTPTSASYGYAVVNGVLYAYGANNELWQVTSGASLGPLLSYWQAVVSFFPVSPGGWAVGYVADGPRPFAWFNNQVYGAYYTGGTFSIYRSPQSSSQNRTWELVAANGFGDLQNHGLAFIAPFNGKLVAGTTETRSGLFGDPSGFGTGVEIWESATGNLGPWAQVNAGGFGTNTTIVGSSTTVRTNQDIGSAQVYNGSLYVGTKSHYGAEVWRYNGGGTTGWTNVTPTWAGVCDLGCGPGRNEAMAVFQGQLYMGEGFPTANLARFNGTSWAIEVVGPNPFAAQNGGVKSLAVLNGDLYAATLHAPYSGVTQGDQVWATPFASGLPLCTKIPSPILFYDPPKINFVVPAQRVELWTRISNVGDGLYQGGGRIELSKGDMVVMSRDIPALGPQESVELPVVIDLSPGTNHFSRTVFSRQSDPCQQGNTLHFTLEGGAR